MLNKYEFSEGTLAIVPNDDKSSLVLEDDDRYIINNSTFNIMEDSCRYFGSSYVGRKEGAKDILGSEYKVPILIKDDLIAFPTSSPYSADCSWISLNRIYKIEKIDQYNTKIVFDNNNEIIIPCSFRSIENQMSRASRLNHIINKRKNS